MPVREVCSREQQWLLGERSKLTSLALKKAPACCDVLSDERNQLQLFVSLLCFNYIINAIGLQKTKQVEEETRMT